MLVAIIGGADCQFRADLVQEVAGHEAIVGTMVRQEQDINLTAGATAGLYQGRDIGRLDVTQAEHVEASRAVQLDRRVVVGLIDDCFRMV